MTYIPHGTRRPVGLLLVLLLSVSCRVSEPPPVVVEQEPEPLPPATAEGLLQLATLSNQARADEYRLSAAELLIAEQRFGEARQALAAISQGNRLDDTGQIRLAIAQADLALAADEPELALERLDSSLTTELSRQGPVLRQQVAARRAQALLASNRYAESVRQLAEFDGNRSLADRQQANNLIWQALQQASGQQLAQLAGGAGTYQLRGWVELARSMRAQEQSIPAQLAALDRWRSTWNRHEALDPLPSALQSLNAVWDRRPTHIALLLPLQEQIGRAVQEGFVAAYYQSLATDGSAPRVSVYDTSGLSQIREVYNAAVQAGADLVIGPLNKDLVRQLDNLPALPVTTLALNYTDFPTRHTGSFFQFGLASEDEIRQTAATAWNAGLRNAALVVPDSVEYDRLRQAFVSTWQNLGGNVVTSVSYGNEGDYADTIKRLLAIDASENRARRITALLPRDDIQFVPARRGDIDFIFLMANARQGRQIKPTLAFYFAENIPVYALPAIYDGSSNQLTNQDLNGIIFTDTPWLLETSPLKEIMANTLRPTLGTLQRLRALGIDSFRLYARLEQLATGELVGFRGATGSLSINESGIVERIPETAVFVDGQVELLDRAGGLVRN